MYKCKEKLLPESLSDLLANNSSYHGYETRNNMPNVPIHTTSMFNKSYLVKGIMEWQYLNSDIKRAISYKLFVV